MNAQFRGNALRSLKAKARLVHLVKAWALSGKARARQACNLHLTNGKARERVDMQEFVGTAGKEGTRHRSVHVWLRTTCGENGRERSILTRSLR